MSFTGDDFFVRRDSCFSNNIIKTTKALICRYCFKYQYIYQSKRNKIFQFYLSIYESNERKIAIIIKLIKVFLGIEDNTYGNNKHENFQLSDT